MLKNRGKSSKSEMSSHSSLIWFLLLDSTTGLPYKDTSASSILRSSLVVPVIDQFRDAVKAKYDTPNYLKDIPSSVLLVYKNKSAFDNRHADIDGRKENPLEEDSLVDDFGTSKKEALIVVVPSSDELSFAHLFSFQRCNDPFFNGVWSATERGGWISFKHDIPSTTLNNLYIRESYRTIASRINPDINKAIVTGTPGIGKSLFLFYLLWKLVQERKRVLFIYHPFNIYYDSEGNVFWFASGHLPYDNDKSFWNDTLWCLFDAKGKDESCLNKFPYGSCTFVVSTSPRRELLNDFKKPPQPQIFYMPLWTEPELENISSCFPSAIDWHTRFEILGGIPRHVLESTDVHPTALLETACKQCDLKDCIKSIGMNSTITDKSKVVHSLVHMTSVSPFTESSVCYASDAALNVIIRNKGNEAKRKMRDLLDSCEGNPLTAALCGYVFESYAIELLEQGGVFKCRELVHANTKIKPRDTEQHIPPSMKTVVDKVEPDQPHHQLHVPKTANYAAIDAWIPGLGAFQMTVGKRHDIHRGVENDLAMLGAANRLYWLLPPLHYHSFTKKAPYEIEQHAILIPYPE